MHFQTLLDISAILGFAILIFGFRFVLMVLGLGFAALVASVWGIVRLVRWVCE